LPDELVGVWSDSQSKFSENKTLITGNALYLKKDGSGMMVFAAPPIGSEIKVFLDNQNNLLDIQILENGTAIHKGQMRYHPSTNTLEELSDPKRFLTRRYRLN
jgi:hypothetical protein